MFPPKYLPFSSYIISPFLIIFSLSLPYYLSPFLSFPTSIISLFSFHPLIIYLPPLIFSFLQQSQKEVLHLPKKKSGLDTLLSSQIYELVCRYLLSYKPGFCVYVNGPCEIVLTIIKDQVRLLKQNKNIPWMRFFQKVLIYLKKKKTNKKIKQITIASLFLFIILILKAVN